ncbi:nuclear transport factor 2 family protein [Nonomuraea sp. NPDC049784]|uniref:nuclear transport factor 2 family protein n=1 Tax=Nonomuraea sp. NPDC049784 TaxID=3154361 RepID=UPI0033D5A462
MKILVGAVLALSVMASPAQAKNGCADAREEVASIKGWVSPNACTFINRQIRFGKVTTENRVQAYVDIWDTNATLWEPRKASAPLMQGLDTIRASIAGTLALVPDFRFRGTRVAVNGPAVMFEAVNEATVKGHKITYPAVYRVLLTDDGKVIQGRRYYDRHLMFSPLDPSLPDLFSGVADSGLPEEGGQRAMGPDELAARAEAWNTEDVAALTAPLSGAALSASGLGERELRTAEGKRAYLTTFFGQVSDVKLQPGQAVRVPGATYVEWYGTVLPKGQSEPMSFGIIERIADQGGLSTRWQLFFDQLPLVADQTRIDQLYGLLR